MSEDSDLLYEVRELADDLRYATGVYLDDHYRGYRQAEDDIKRKLLAILGPREVTEDARPAMNRTTDCARLPMAGASVNRTVNKSLDTEVPMPLWALIHSARYAMGRNTYANCDAARLCERYWGDLPNFIRDQLMEDYRRISWDGPMKVAGDRECWQFMWRSHESHKDGMG